MVGHSREFNQFYIHLHNYGLLQLTHDDCIIHGNLHERNIQTDELFKPKIPSDAWTLRNVAWPNEFLISLGTLKIRDDDSERSSYSSFSIFALVYESGN